MKPLGDYVGKGTVGGSLAFLVLVMPTEWLGALPPIPDGYFLPLVSALGVVLTAVLDVALGRRSNG